MSQVISKIANRTSVKFYALVLGAALALTPVAALAQHQAPEGTPGFRDLDHDTMNDNTEDNCSPLPDAAADASRNRLQRDTDGDGYGNLCDADYDNNGIVGWSDFGLFATVAGTVDTVRRPAETPTSAVDWDDEFWVGEILVTPELMDHNADGRVDVLDFDILVDGFGLGPGPSSVANAQ